MGHAFQGTGQILPQLNPRIVRLCRAWATAGQYNHGVVQPGQRLGQPRLDLNSHVFDAADALNHVVLELDQLSGVEYNQDRVPGSQRIIAVDENLTQFTTRLFEPCEANGLGA
ncbi:MAG: hypothetical protein HZY76_04940 [Anaerolineae bacterium]|nr:MAG: hypothetical protein HZY76_04940 [Anaerolineae bacterium]